MELLDMLCNHTKQQPICWLTRNVSRSGKIQKIYSLWKVTTQKIMLHWNITANEWSSSVNGTNDWSFVFRYTSVRRQYNCHVHCLFKSHDLSHITQVAEYTACALSSYSIKRTWLHSIDISCVFPRCQIILAGNWPVCERSVNCNNLKRLLVKS